MSCPFPGMDPYLEAPAFWMDFHFTFINYWREALADVLPADYEANIGERVYLIEHEPDARKLIYPDVSVSDEDSSTRERATQAGGVATLEPITIPIAIPEGPREAYVEILHLPERALVTVLERLSPTNKEQPGRTEYLQKRNAILHQQVHLVELDLLVGGQRPPLEKPWPVGDYHYLVSRWQDRPDSQVYSWTVRDPLPTLPVPLRHGDADLAIDLGKVFATAFERGRFTRRLARRGECPAPLSADSKAWAERVAAGAN
jgi:hypothetical protein